MGTLESLNLNLKCSPEKQTSLDFDNHTPDRVEIFFEGFRVCAAGRCDEGLPGGLTNEKQVVMLPVLVGMQTTPNPKP